MLGLDPITSTILIGGALVSVSFYLGREYGKSYANDHVEDAIVYLCEEGYIKHKQNLRGEIELIKINE